MTPATAAAAGARSEEEEQQQDGQGERQMGGKTQDRTGGLNEGHPGSGRQNAVYGASGARLFAEHVARAYVRGTCMRNAKTRRRL